jgi:hypothetical protein
MIEHTCMHSMTVNRRAFLRAVVPASLFSVCPGLAFPQEYNPGYDLGEKTYVSVRSSVLGEDRTAEVILPGEFTSHSEEEYDVIYILDGIRAYHYVAYDYLKGEGFLPKRTILIGLLLERYSHAVQRLHAHQDITQYRRCGPLSDLLKGRTRSRH